MAARAMWKGVLCLGDTEVPVKLYSAVQDRSVHFRLLHRSDQSPVRQAMVNPDTDEVVPGSEIQRAYVTDDGDMVMLAREELDELEPPKSRGIEVLKLLPEQAIDHRWYDRPYYLGPDGDDDAWVALARALDGSGQEALVRWVMRNKEYFGALRVNAGYPMLVSLRHAEEVVPVDSLQAPTGKPLDEREVGMARQLIGMLAAEFEPAEYRDEYRDRVLELIDRKARGLKVEAKPVRRAPKPSEDIAGALEASLKAARAA